MRISPTRTLVGGLLASTMAVAALASSGASAGTADDTGPDTDPVPSASSATGETRSFVDSNGDTIEIPTAPTSIVACGYAVLPLIQAEAPLSAVCEWTRELDNMDEATLEAYEAIPKVAVDGNVATLNYEAVAAAGPDLIVLGVPAPAMSDVRLDVLTELAPVVVLAPTAPGEWRALGEQFADAAGVADAYGESREEYEALVADINEEFAGEFEELTFGALCSACGIFDGTFVREYASSYVSNLFDDLDAVFPGEAADGSHAEDVSLELVGEAFGDVDVIVYGVQADGSPEPGMEELFDSALWQELPAVEAGRVIEVRHHSAATYPTAIAALESIREQLAELTTD